MLVVYRDLNPTLSVRLRNHFSLRYDRNRQWQLPDTKQPSELVLKYQLSFVCIVLILKSKTCNVLVTGP